MNNKINEYNGMLAMQKYMNKYELIAAVVEQLRKHTIDNDKLTIDVVLFAGNNNYYLNAGTRYFESKGLDYLAKKYDSNFAAYALYEINTANKLYLVCTDSID